MTPIKNILTNLWHWWNDVPCTPWEAEERAREIILLSMTITAVNVLGTCINLCLSWQLLSKT